MNLVDIYRGRIAYSKDGLWYWATLADGLSALARPDAPNRHYVICRNGQYGHIIRNPLAHLTVGQEMDSEEVARLETEKFGWVEAVDLSADE